MKIYLISDNNVDLKPVIELLSQKTQSEIIQTTDYNVPEKTPEGRITVFLYSSEHISEESLRDLEHKHDIQIDAATVDAQTVSEIVANLVV